jgi:glutamyl-tRNA reductase
MKTLAELEHALGNWQKSLGPIPTYSQLRELATHLRQREATIVEQTLRRAADAASEWEKLYVQVDTAPHTSGAHIMKLLNGT